MIQYLGYRKINVLPCVYNKFSSASNSASSVKNQSNIKSLNNEFGQPVACTHPHLINEEELVPGVTLKEFQERRTRLIFGIQKYAIDHLQKLDSNKSFGMIKELIHYALLIFYFR